MEKYKNKYRIPSARLQGFDYRSDGAYFITICTQHRQHFFGEIVDGKMQLNEIGQLAHQFWAEIPTHFPFVELGEFVIMPNHTHGILIIEKMADTAANTAIVETLHCNVSTDTTANTAIVETLQCNVSTNTAANTAMAAISPKSGSISTIVRSFKSVVSKYARKIHADFAWQTRFHDHIIRDAMSFDRIQTYIANNPLNWKEDKFHGTTK